MIGNNKLKTIAVGCAKMALKLALVIAQSGFDWLYSFPMKKSCGQMYLKVGWKEGESYKSYLIELMVIDKKNKDI